MTLKHQWALVQTIQGVCCVSAEFSLDCHQGFSSVIAVVFLMLQLVQ